MQGLRLSAPSLKRDALTQRSILSVFHHFFHAELMRDHGSVCVDDLKSLIFIVKYSAFGIFMTYEGATDFGRPGRLVSSFGTETRGEKSGDRLICISK